MSIISRIRLINNKKNIVNNITAYKNGIETLEKSFWKISHEDIVYSIIRIYRELFMKKFLLIITSIRKKNQKDLLMKYLFRWKCISMMIKKSINDKEKRARLKILFLRQENNRIKLSSKFFNKWKSSTLINIKNDKEARNDFCHLYKLWSNKMIEKNKKEFINNVCNRYIDKQGQKFAKIKIRKIFIKSVFKKITKEALNPLIIKINIKKLIVSTKKMKKVQKNNFLISIIRKWRFITFVSNLAKKKLKLMYNNLHVSYLEIADEILNTPEVLTSNEVKDLLNYNNSKKSNHFNSFFIKELGFNSEASFYKSFGKKTFN
jgi:hypothetical protein